MQLLRKSLLLAGFLSVTLAGVINVSSASAVEGFSFEDIANNYAEQRESLISNLLNPSGSNRKSTNSNSTISRNESPSSTLLFNGAPNNTTWGYDGKGVIFTDTDKLVNGNPQLATANRGDTLSYSAKIETQRYNDNAETSPVSQYVIYVLFSEGLTVDMESVVVKIGNQTIDPNEINIDYGEFEENNQMSDIFGGARSAFAVVLLWRDANQQFIYDEDAEITISYTATVSDSAPSEVWSRGAYMSDPTGMDYSIFQSTEHQATALLDGNILIRRVDSSDNPVEGVRYKIDGVQADQKDAGKYIFSKNGATDVFETDSDGKIIVENVPMGRYSVVEVSSPDGSQPKSQSQTKDIFVNQQKIIVGATDIFKIPAGVLNSPSDVLVTRSGKMGDNSWYIEIPQVSGSGAEFKLNPDTGLYQSENIQYMTFRKVDGGFEIASGDNAGWIIKYNEYDGNYLYPVSLAGIAGENTYPISVIVTKIDENTLRLTSKTGSKQAVFSRDDTGDKCYLGDAKEFFYVGGGSTLGDPSQICETGNNEYQLSVPVLNEKGDYSIGARFGHPDEYSIYFEEGAYTDNIYPDNYVYALYGIDEIDDETISVGIFFPVDYVPEMNKYFVSVMGGGGASQFEIYHEVSEVTMSVVEYLFKEGKPESLPINPQTSDAILKSLAIITLSIIPIALARKTLNKR